MDDVIYEPVVASSAYSSMGEDDWAQFEADHSQLPGGDAFTMSNPSGEMTADDYSKLQIDLAGYQSQYLDPMNTYMSQTPEDPGMLKGLLDSFMTKDGKLSAAGTMALVLGGNMLKGMGDDKMLDKAIKARSDEAEKARQTEFDMYKMRTDNKGNVGLIDTKTMAQLQASLQKKQDSVANGGSNSGLLAAVQKRA